VIVVLPTGNVLPDGLRVIVTAEQLSVAVAMPGSTVVSQVVAPEPVYAVTAAGTSVNVGPVESYNCKYNGRRSSVAGSVIVTGAVICCKRDCMRSQSH
jgi:hypothetical protein